MTNMIHEFDSLRTKKEIRAGASVNNILNKVLTFDSIKLLCHSNEWVNYLFRVMCSVHAK